MADPNDLGLNLYDIYSPDQAVSQNAAAALARALRGRQALGMVGAASGDPAITQSAQGMLQQGNALQGELAGAGQHKAQQDLLRQQHAIEMAKLQEQMEYQRGILNLRGRQVDVAGLRSLLGSGKLVPQQDAYGNVHMVHGYDPGTIAQIQSLLGNEEGPQQTPPSGPAAPAGPPPAGQVLPRSTGAVAPSPALKQPALPMFAGPLAPESVQALGDTAVARGEMPTDMMRRGKAGNMDRQAVLSYVTQTYPGVSFAGNKAANVSDTHSLTALQHLTDSTNAFEKTASNNLAQFMDTVGKLGIDLGSPLANAPAREIANKLGSTGMTAFNTARQVAVQEIGKVLASAAGSGAISDSQRQEVAALIPPDATVAQIKQAHDILVRDMENRRTAYAGQLKEIQDRIANRGRPASAAPTPASPTVDRDALRKKYGLQ